VYTEVKLEFGRPSWVSTTCAVCCWPVDEVYAEPTRRRQRTPVNWGTTTPRCRADQRRRVKLQRRRVVTGVAEALKVPARSLRPRSTVLRRRPRHRLEVAPVVYNRATISTTPTEARRPRRRRWRGPPIRSTTAAAVAAANAVARERAVVHVAVVCACYCVL